MGKKAQHLYREQYYVKKGNKYVLVNDPYAYDGLAPGAWLVVVDGNCTSVKKAVNPKFIELDAALKYLETGLCNALLKASEMRPKTIRITEKERRAWREFRRIMGEDMPSYVEYPSNCEVAQKACEYIRKIMIESNCNIDKIKENYETKERKFTNPIFDLET